MPNNRNASKAMRQADKRRLKNRGDRSTLRTAIKKFRTAVATEGASDAVKKELQTVAKRLDQAASKNLIHANVASRTKSRLATLVNKTPAKPSAAGAEAT